MQNFGKIKNSFNSLLVEAIATNDTKKKKLFKEPILMFYLSTQKKK